MTRCLIGLAALGIVMPGTVGAQSVFENAVADVRHGLGDTYYVLASPLRADQKDWLAFGGVIAIGALSSIVDDDIDSWIVRQRAKGNLDIFKEAEDPSDLEWNDVGAARLLSKISLGVWAVGLATDSRTLRDAGMGCLASWVAIAGAREVNYRIWFRTRPSESDGNQYLTGWSELKSPDWIDRSFIAGHFANPMGCTKLWADRFEMGWVEPVFYATSFAIGAQRMVNRHHWFSDVVIAGALGYVAGRLVAQRQNERLEKERCAEARRLQRPDPRCEQDSR